MDFNCDSFVFMNYSEFQDFPELPHNLKICMETQDLCVFSDNERSISTCNFVSQGTQTYKLPSPNVKTSCVFDEDGCDCKNMPSNIKDVISCNCIKNGCLKKYCVCRKAGVKCNDTCHCSGCENC